MTITLDPALIFDTTIPFKQKALEIFDIQRNQNTIYAKFCKVLAVNKVQELADIPLLPIQAFKDTKMICLPESSSIDTSELDYFQSSGTSRMQRSTHFLVDPAIYRSSITEGMNRFYEIDDYVILAYTPGYNSNPHSSLVWMLNDLISKDSSGLSQFLELDEALNVGVIKQIKAAGKKVLLFGAAFGLLDLIELGINDFPKDSIIIETGGMKTFRREMTKSDLHNQLADGFGLALNQIHSEYGMTELLSQAYSLGDEWFQTVPWMHVSIRNPENPQEEVAIGEEGLIGIIDLANVYSCSFLLTGDKGIRNEKGEFQVLGRWSSQNLRGCNFLIDQD